MSRGGIKAYRLRIKWQMMERDGGCCFWCDQPLTYATWTFDHIIPRSQSGPYSADNGVSSCKACNGDRGNMPAAEYLKTRRSG